MLTAIAFIIILAILVLIHEFGHFIAAKLNGVKVEEFGFGFPPRVFGIKFGETLYSINALPIGGFVKVMGEEYNELNESQLSEEVKNRAFVYKKPWQKTIIIVAGILMNFLLGWVLISFLFTQGVPSPTKNVYVEQVQPNSPAQQVGIKAGDSLVKITKNGQSYELKSPADLITVAKKYADQPLTVVVSTEGKERQVTMTPRKNPPAGQGSLGVVITSFVTKKYPWYSAPFYGLKEAFNITSTIVTELAKTVVGLVTFQKTKVEVTGPIGIAQYTGQAIKFGNNAVLELVALLSLNLAVINILPFPALDGGRLVFIIYEWVTKKRANANLERNLNMAGFFILISLTVVITVHDILKLIK